MEYIQDIKCRNGGITRKMFYKPYNSNGYVSMNIVKDPTTQDKDYMITDIEHGVKLPNDAREMHKSEYDRHVLRTLDFVDKMY